MGPWETLYEVIVIGKFAELLNIAKSTFAMAWMSLTMVETLVKTGGGVGIILTQDDKLINIANVLFIDVLLIAVGKLMDQLFTIAINAWCPHFKLSQIRK